MRCVSCDAELSGTPSRCPDCGADPLLDGRYRLEEIIGRGAHGTVYRSTDTQSGSALAIKELPLRHGLGAKQQELFAREAAVLRQLSHPNIPRYFGELIAGSGKSRALFLLQAFVPGRPLSAELAEHRYTEAEVRDLIAEVAGTLAYLHSLSPPVIHRDVKPSNLMRRPDGGLSLIDFGAVRDALRDSQLGGSTVAGTFGYMAPEQFMGDASPATDIFGLGVTALALLSRREPSSLYTRTGELRWEDELPPRSTLRPLLRRMLAPDPDERFQDAGALLAFLSRPEPAPAFAPAPVLTSPRPPRAQARFAEPASATAVAEALSDGPDQPLQVRRDQAVRLRGQRITALAMVVLAFLGALGSVLLFSAAPEPVAMPPAPIAAPVPTPAPVPVAPEVVVPPEHRQMVVLEAADFSGIGMEQSKPPPLLEQVRPKVSSSDMQARGVAEETCSFLYTIKVDGSTEVLGVTDPDTCSDASYVSGYQALSQWTYEAPSAPMTHATRFTFKVR